MKAVATLIVSLGALATPLAAQTPVAPAPAASVSHEADPATMLNRAAAMVARGEYRAARSLYEQVAAMPADYKLETTAGGWAYPAEIARRGLYEIARRDRLIELAARD